MTRLINRRRFLKISAATAAIPVTAVHAAMPVAEWRGTALGARASVQLVGLTRDEAAPVFEAFEGELRRLESIFSLYRPDAEISRLNTDGHLTTPSSDFLALLSICDRLHGATDGVFDPTVQPIYMAVASAAAEGRNLTSAERDTALTCVGWNGVQFDAREIRLSKPGAALTLNGIAQGYITDRIAHLLRSRGFLNVMIDMGEVAALGRRSDGTPWRAGVADLEGNIIRELRLSDRALATSAPMGTDLTQSGEVGHIFEPSTARVPTTLSLVSVSADTAVIADGLSTALCLLPPDRHGAVPRRFRGCRIEVAI